ncbi:hypothetical protein DRH27_01515 [Candidatus Falkowbacteria bacterium]|nr:MAG: hypothetical protein DRH27_01515 [Candidatus Falkowbacteria bacterium]
MAINIITYLILIGLGYIIVIFLFDILLRGFVPFIPSRPWVVEQILSELEIPQSNPKMFAFSSGRSGFFLALEKKYPDAVLVAVESDLFPYLVAKTQAFVRQTRIKVIRQPIHRVNIKEVDFIYSHLYPDKMEGIGAKLKFECRPGTQIVSTGFNFRTLTPKKVIELPDVKGKFAWLSRNQNLFHRKSKKFKKEKKAFFYEI